MNPTFELPDGKCGCLICKGVFIVSSTEHLSMVHPDPDEVDRKLRELHEQGKRNFEDFQQWKREKDNAK